MNAKQKSLFLLSSPQVILLFTSDLISYPVDVVWYQTPVLRRARQI